MPLKFTLLTVVALSALFGGVSGRELVEKRCGSCHMVSNPTIEQVKHMVAPPMWGVARHIKREIPQKDEFVSFVADYIMEPAEEKIRFNKEAFRRFGLMPSMKGTMTDAEARLVAEYLYETY